MHSLPLKEHGPSLYSDRGDGDAHVVLLFVSQGPSRLQGDCTILHVSKVKKRDSDDAASLVTVFLSPISGISPLQYPAITVRI